MELPARVVRYGPAAETTLAFRACRERVPPLHITQWTFRGQRFPRLKAGVAVRCISCDCVLVFFVEGYTIAVGGRKNGLAATLEEGSQPERT